MRASLLALALGLAACQGRTAAPKPPEWDASSPPPDGGGALCQGPLGPSCCDGAGQRVGSASCADGAWTCSPHQACRCGGEPMGFFCSDFCGSDVLVEPHCAGSEWLCPLGLVASNTCPAGSCWGEPGDCCVAPSCDGGVWQCESIRTPCE